MELNKANIRKLSALIAFAILLFWGLQNLTKVLDFCGTIVSLVLPFLVGACIAFILNVPMVLVESKLLGPLDGTRFRKAKRPLAVVVTILLFIGLLFIITFLVMPELIRTVSTLKDSVPAFLWSVQLWANNLIAANPEITQWVGTLDFSWGQIWPKIVSFAQSGVEVLFSSSVNILSSVFNGLFSFFLGLFFAIYILAQKETLTRQGKQLLYAYLPEAAADKTVGILRLTYRTFANFLSGQCTEAVILGTMFFIGMTILRFPYPLMIGVLIGFTALIPIFGAFIGAFVATFLILMVSPVKAFWFVIFFLVLQQIEGNLIYPKVVGGSVGLPSIWVLVAVTLGGSTMGVVGMLIFIPLCSVVYTLLKAHTAHRLTDKAVARDKYLPPDQG